uniref:glycine rich extracellular protein 1 n=1 Tax=Euleptes europaea TaxID=460621 RepID=UPI00253F9746|nr:glycine rich extracellular protein 1 [Euleptes europaea]
MASYRSARCQFINSAEEDMRDQKERAGPEAAKENWAGTRWGRVGGVQPGAGLGPAGAKAGKYPGYGGPGGLPTGLGAQNGFGAGPSFMGRPGYGVPAGYGPGLGAYPQVGKQKPGYRGAGYPRVGLPLGGLGARGKPSKTGYGAGPGAYPGAGVQQAYPGGVGAGGYLGNGLQNGYGNGFGAGGNGFPSAGLQPGGYGNGAQAPYGGQLGGPAGDPSIAKYGGAGQVSYNGQPQQPETTGLAGDYGNGRYGEGEGERKADERDAALGGRRRTLQLLCAPSRPPAQFTYKYLYFSHPTLEGGMQQLTEIMSGLG